MAYARGDLVVHPQHGTAAVTGVVQKDVGSGPTEYLELFVEHASLRIMVPAAAVAEIGIREVSTKEQADEVLAVLASEADVFERWSDRNAVTIARVRSADLRALAMVVRDLEHHVHRSGKPLSDSERTTWDACLTRLTRELSVSMGLSVEDTTALVLEQCAPSDAKGSGRSGGLVRP